MNPPSETLAIFQWAHDLRLSFDAAEVLTKLRERLIREVDKENKKTLKTLIAMELKSQGMYAESASLYLDIASEFPDEPLPLISLAEQKLYYEEQPDDALTICKRAVEVAYRSGNFRRQALGVQARIAQKMERYDLVEEALRSILALEVRPGQSDVAIERDFFDRLPPGAIDHALARQYDFYARQ